MHDRHSIRLRGYDYSQDGYYFVTVCVEHRLCILGSVGADLCVRPNNVGLMIEHWWRNIVNKYTNIVLDVFQLMPNHIHAIIVVRGQTNGRTHRSAPTLGNIIQWFKTMTTNAYYKNVKESGWPIIDHRLWQRNYYEHIIRSEKEYFAIRKYIVDNPKNWNLDTEFIDN